MSECACEAQGLKEGYICGAPECHRTKEAEEAMRKVMEQATQKFMPRCVMGDCAVLVQYNEQKDQIELLQIALEDMRKTKEELAERVAVNEEQEKYLRQSLKEQEYRLDLRAQTALRFAERAFKAERELTEVEKTIKSLQDAMLERANADPLTVSQCRFPHCGCWHSGERQCEPSPAWGNSGADVVAYKPQAPDNLNAFRL